MLGPIQDNGGPTLTYELLGGSPAIDAGNPNFTPPPDYDQRGPGYARIMNTSRRYRLVRGAGDTNANPHSNADIYSNTNTYGHTAGSPATASSSYSPPMRRPAGGAAVYTC